MKKFVPFLTIIALMMAAAFPLAFASFPDVDSSHPYYDAVNYVQDEGIVDGYDDGTFQSDNTINRAEFTKILINSVYDEETINSCELPSDVFPDFDHGEWFAPYVCVAYENDVINGYDDGTFHPENTINFAESAKIIVNGLGYETEEAQEGQQWYTPYVSILSYYQAIPDAISTLSEQTRYTHEISRGETASVLFDLLWGTNPRTITFETSCDPDSVEYDYNYLATFNAFEIDDDGAETGGHYIQLAASEDGDDWELVDGWEMYDGYSVPSIFFYEDYLYVIHTGEGVQKHNIQKVNKCFEVEAEIYIDIFDSDGVEHGYVDPDIWVENGVPYFVHLHTEGTEPGTNLGTCGTFPCTVSMPIAVPTDESLEVWEIVDDAGLYVEMTGEDGEISHITDPDIFELSDGTYVMLVSHGSNAFIFTSDSATGTYAPPNGGDEGWLQVSNSGGVPSGIEVDGEIWLYVSSGNGIDKAIMNNVEDIPQDFYTVMDGESLFNDDSWGVGSPAIMEWPEEW